MKAFTLLELLIVCAIVAVLAAMLFPVLSQAKAAAKGTQCLAQESQLGLALTLYASDYDDGAPAAGEEGNDEGEFNADSWLDVVQPYLRSRLVCRCPNDQSTAWDFLVGSRQTSYGLNAFFAPNHPPYYGFSLGQTSQPSQCVLVAELADWVTDDHFAPMYWGDPPLCGDRDRQIAQWDPKTHAPKSLQITRHAAGANYLFVDLHVKKMSFGQLWRQAPGLPPTLNAFDPTR